MLKYIVALGIFVGLIAAGTYYFNAREPNVDEPMPQSASHEYTVEEYAHGLEVPWSMVWTSPSRMLVTERPGRIRVIENGKLLEEPLHTFPEVISQAEEGLMSLALHPDYDENKFVYVVYAYRTERGFWDIVVRFTDNGHSISDVTTILNAIPAAQFHAGSRMKFGPDGKLYITTGDATDGDIAQDLDSLGGKILRLNDDGTIPNDNPFPNSPVWSYGHRNPQGIDWDAAGNMYESEHGPSGFDGPGGGDEVNRIEKGKNYGWPVLSHEESRDDMVSPIALYTPAEAPASLLIYSGSVLPLFSNNLFFGALRGEGIWRLVIGDTPDTVASQEKLFDGKYGRIRDIAQGPDGYIYFSTSNRDGRGDAAESDDRIMRIVPKK